MYNPNPNEINYFGATNFRNRQHKFGIKLDDRRRHMYIVGKTGMGKTTLLENMVIQDIKNGHGLAFIDPHGDSSEKILNFIPPERINDVIYFNPGDYDYPIAFNVVEQVEPHLRHLVASGLVGVFKKLWADSWGPRLEYILRNAILAVLDYPNSTLLAIIRILSDKEFRKQVIENIQDPVVKSFWVNEFAGYADKFASEAVAPIQNKVGQFLSTSLIRNIVGQVKSTIDMRDVMDNQKILIMNLSKGRIGEDSSALLGAMMITKIQMAAMSRVDIPEDERRDFYLYIDEFQNFSTESFANILSEARKYRLNLIMAHQYIEQLNEIVRGAVFGNVGTMVTFRVGAADAGVLVKDFAPRFTEEDLVNLTKFEIYLKLMIDGVASEPFSAGTLPPLFEPEAPDTADKVIRVSRERYAQNREMVEEHIRKWSEALDEGRAQAHKDASSAGQKENKPPAMGEILFKGKVVRAEISDKPTPDRQIPWICDNCERITHLSFQPNPKKPVYCKSCLREFQDQPLPPVTRTVSASVKPAAPTGSRRAAEEERVPSEKIIAPPRLTDKQSSAQPAEQIIGDDPDAVVLPPRAMAAKEAAKETAGEEEVVPMEETVPTEDDGGVLSQLESNIKEGKHAAQPFKGGNNRKSRSRNRDRHNNRPRRQDRKPRQDKSRDTRPTQSNQSSQFQS